MTAMPAVILAWMGTRFHVPGWPELGSVSIGGIPQAW